MKARDVLELKGALLFTVSPDTRIETAIETMEQHDIGSLVVMNKGRFVGMLTFREILHLVSKQKARYSLCSVGDIMNTEVPTADMETDVQVLSQLMIASHCRYIPIFEKDLLMGVISLYDVAKSVLKEQEQENAMLRAYIHEGMQN